MEDNPGPTIFGIIDPTSTVSADSSQGSETIFGVNAGKVMCSNVTSWYYTIKYKSNSTLNNILVIGNNLYSL